MSSCSREADTLGALNQMIELLAASNPFQAPRLKAAGIGDGVGSLEEFVRRMPFTSKQELIQDQARHPPYGTNQSFAREQYVRCHRTSATTGTALRWLDTEESWRWMVQGRRHVFEQSGIGKGDRLLFAFSFGPHLGFWLGFEAAREQGALCISGAGLSSEARLAEIATHEINVLCATPTYALHLGEAARADRWQTAREGLRQILVGGEPGGSLEAVRKRLKSLWPNAIVIDHYGLTEVGPLTCICSDDAELMELIPDAYFTELIDPATGTPLPADSTDPGELVVTNLGRLGSPVLRYRTGDLVSRAPGGDLLLPRFRGGVLGRVDDMVVIRGMNLFPSSFEQILLSVVEVAEYQVLLDTRKTLPEIRVKVETTPDTLRPENLAADIAARLKDALHLRIPVEIAPPDSLPRFKQKARRWKRIG